MAINKDSNEYVIPRGTLYFDPFDGTGEKTGERELGNAPSFSIEITSEKADHYNSQAGLREKDASVTVQVDRVATLTIDNISLENLAMFFSGSVSAISQATATEATESLTVQTGRHYQLGVTAAAPTGVRNVSEVVIKDSGDSDTYTLGEDYELDADMGRIKILAGGDIDDDDVINLTYDVAAKTWDRAATGSVSELRGALRSIADNASGSDRDFYMPSVTLSPSGALPIITADTDFVAMEFSLEVLKPTTLEAIYVDGRPAAV